MKNWKTIALVLITIFIFWFLKFYLRFPVAEAGIVSTILTIASILFGFLAGFFISELWSRYAEIRTLQGERCSSGLNMIKCAEYFFGNKVFEERFKKLVEKSSLVDEIAEWTEGHLEIPYFRAIGDSFESIEVKNQKDQVYFDNLLSSYHKFVECTVKLDTLGKERLFPSEWFVIILLFLTICMSILFLDVSRFFSRVIVFVFPVIIVMALSIIYNLNTLLWSKEIVSLEPNQHLFDAIGVKRFYLKKKKKFIYRHIKDYRTEDDLKEDLKQVYLDIIESRKS